MVGKRTIKQQNDLISRYKFDPRTDSRIIVGVDQPQYYIAMALHYVDDRCIIAMKHVVHAIHLLE